MLNKPLLFMISATNVLVCNSACLCLRMGELKISQKSEKLPSQNRKL